MQRKGYRGAERGIRTLLYCAPEEFIEGDHPYAFDVYGVAITWLQLVIPGLQTAEALFEWRVAIRDERHDLEAWQENTVLHDKPLPEGWEEFFACSEGREAWRLVVNLLQNDPAQRPSASDALMSPYLNPYCDEESRPEPPPVPWSLTSHLEALLMQQQSDDDDDICVISDALYGSTISVEIPVDELHTLVLIDDTNNNGGVVIDGDGSEEDGSCWVDNARICGGDRLLEIGPIDVEKSDLHHIQTIVKQWPQSTVRLQFRRYHG